LKEAKKEDRKRLVGWLTGEKREINEEEERR
jgi:hypothetical protein